MDTLAGERWNLADQRPRHFTMIAFYRGLHCPSVAIENDSPVHGES